MSANSALALNLKQVRKKLHDYCVEAERRADDVTLLAVSKTKPLPMLIEAHQLGQKHFAENYAQEAIEKRTRAPFDDGIWHFIGPLQSNKTRGIAEHFDWVHTVERLKTAQRLSDQRPIELPPLNVLIQVNISRDSAKSGVTPDQCAALARQISILPRLSFRGLMTIPAFELSEAELLEQFRQLETLQVALSNEFPDCTELSMGMSNDYHLAIAAGATMVRIGSDIFGARQQNQKTQLSSKDNA